MLCSVHSGAKSRPGTGGKRILGFGGKALVNSVSKERGFDTGAS